MFKRRIKAASAFVIVMVVALLAMACDTATTTASCAFVVGDGTDGSDTKLHDTVLPGQKIPVNKNEKISFFPCNSRNYIINNGNVKNANGENVGDRGTLITATTKSGVTIQIAARALWTLNQSETAMRNFYNVCFKYQCASDKDVSGDVNFSTKGWNGMLAENFGPTMDSIARIAAIKVDDSIWKTHDPAQYQALSDSMSAEFANAMRKNLGYSEDLFCGSGNSAWSNPEEPGDGKFTCSPVRIVVDDVQQVAVQSDRTSQGAVALNQQRLANAQALYGPEAGRWLALQDLVDKCKESGSTCVFNFGGADFPASAIPGNNPAAPR